MFDLFGKSVDVPLPALALEDFDVTLQERLLWEKELMGFYFSEHPLSAVASKLAEHATVLCGEINNEMAGEKVIVAGMVTAVRHVTTRNNRLFVIATFEDLNGSIEVTVWADVYSQTQDFWVDGSILLVEGYVKVREDRANINCTKVSRYEPEPVKAEPVRPDNGRKNNHVKPRTLIINIRQSEDSQKDLEHLQKVMGVLRRYPGNDSVQLAIRRGDEITRMEVPDIKVDYSEELLRELTPQISS
jgi:DNA polymerase-3 subunit alpha